MAWNPSKEVAVARDAAKALDNAPMCMVFWVTEDGRLGMATYGRTKALCAEAKRIGEQAWKALQAEEEPVTSGHSWGGQGPIILNDESRRFLKSGDRVQVTFRGQVTEQIVVLAPRAFTDPGTGEKWWSIETNRGGMPLDRVTALIPSEVQTLRRKLDAVEREIRRIESVVRISGDAVSGSGIIANFRDAIAEAV